MPARLVRQSLPSRQEQLRLVASPVPRRTTVRERASALKRGAEVKASALIAEAANVPLHDVLDSKNHCFSALCIRPLLWAEIPKMIARKVLQSRSSSGHNSAPTPRPRSADPSGPGLHAHLLLFFAWTQPSSAGCPGLLERGPFRSKSQAIARKRRRVSLHVVPCQSCCTGHQAVRNSALQQDSATCHEDTRDTLSRTFQLFSRSLSAI